MPDEIARLYELYIQDVYLLALSYLHSKQDAEDICQSVFLRLLDKPVKLKPGKEKAFLLTCTANACKNHLRSFWRRNVEPMDDTIPCSTDSDRELWDAIGRLPPKYRAVIHLYYFEGYDHNEIGQILKLSRTAVQTRANRAREMLKKELIQNA